MQVITGGHYDVDCYIEDPSGRTIYRETKKQYDSFPHHTELTGIYTFCFSNEFSTFSHKTVYFNLQVGDEPPILPDMGTRVTALTQVCCSMWPNGTTPARPLHSPLLSAEVPAARQWCASLLVAEQGRNARLGRRALAEPRGVLLPTGLQRCPSERSRVGRPSSAAPPPVQAVPPG